VEDVRLKKAAKSLDRGVAGLRRQLHPVQRDDELCCGCK
jgi:hypothetical protein